MVIQLKEVEEFSSASCLHEAGGLVCSVKNLERVVRAEVFLLPQPAAWQDFV